VHYLSTRNKNKKESFVNILYEGLSKDGGLYLPSSWPLIPYETLKNKSYKEVAHDVIYPFLKDDIDADSLVTIIDKTYENFHHKEVAPLVKLNKNKYVLELFYGPTFSFKDYALQFLGNLFDYFIKNNKNNITFLGATSGDTGSAAINALKGKKNIQVFILHPYEKISKVQRLQMTTVLDNNIHNIALKGNFDDCQRIVKKLFLDNDLQNKTPLSAVNSINWARLIAQVVYYFWSYIKLDQKKINFIVPTGNFGNVFSARIAKYMGLPIEQLHIVTNANDILHRTINEGRMFLNKVEKTYSPSMDIQISSNFERQLFESANRDSDLINKIMLSFLKTGDEVLPDNLIKDIRLIYNSHSVSNTETLNTIRKFTNKYNYLSDPHTATGLSVLENLISENPTVSLACAHPAKFGNVIKAATGKEAKLPSQIDNIFDKEEKMVILDNDIQIVKNHIIDCI
tara:strand:- start:4857 stop:6224 length:1368 start_codon:yes stop_codon:yes gene_type:complete